MSKSSEELKVADSSEGGGAQEEPLIQVRSLSKRYESSAAEEYALRELSLDIEQGEMVAIIGTSGSGKTTLLNILGGLDRSFTGSLKVKGSELRGRTDRELSRWRNQEVGFIFQHFHLLDHLTVLDNVLLPACLMKSEDAHKATEVQARALELIKQVGLEDKVEVRPTQLSGGQKQRVAIARALLFEPSLLLCDEPTGSLDRHTGEEIIKLFQALHQQGYTILMITHEERLSEVAQRVIRLEDGRLRSDERCDQGGESA